MYARAARACRFTHCCALQAARLAGLLHVALSVARPPALCMPFRPRTNSTLGIASARMDVGLVCRLCSVVSVSLLTQSKLRDVVAYATHQRVSPPHTYHIKGSGGWATQKRVQIRDRHKRRNRGSRACCPIPFISVTRVPSLGRRPCGASPVPTRCARRCGYADRRGRAPSPAISRPRDT